MNFTSKNVKRSIRNFKRKIDNLLSAGQNVYQTRVNELINLIINDEIINSIVGPYLEMDINFEEIQKEQGGWINLKLPEDENLQVGYVLQILKASYEGEFKIDMYAHRIFRNKNLNYDISEWNSQILVPCLQILLDKLNDIIEDKVEGNEVVSSSSLKIINYGSISAEQGNVAIGNNINQDINIENISKQIIERALEEEVIEEDEVDKVQEASNELGEELKKEKPSKSKLQSIINSLYGIGKKALIAIVVDVMSNPKLTEEVANFLLN